MKDKDEIQELILADSEILKNQNPWNWQAIRLISENDIKHEEKTKMTMAIIGGSGFVGTRLAKRLIEAGHTVKIAADAHSA